MTLIQKIQALVAALRAQDWPNALPLAYGIAQEIYLDLFVNQNKQPHVLMMAHTAPATVEGCCDELDACCAAGALDLGKILAILAALAKLLPVLIG